MVIDKSHRLWFKYIYATGFRMTLLKTPDYMLLAWKDDQFSGNLSKKLDCLTFEN